MADLYWLWQVAAVVAAIAGFAWLALGMEGHWRQVHGHGARHPAGRRGVRILGSVALAVCGVLCFVANRPSIAILVFLMLLAFTAPLVAFTLTWRPTVLRWLWPRSP